MLTPDCRGLFDVTGNTIYLDHGSFGVAPHEVMARRKQLIESIEQAPASFFALDYRPAWKETAAMVARRFSAPPENLALIENVTDGINAVLRSLHFDQGDEILVTSLAYGAIRNAAAHVAGRQGARTVPTPIKFPRPDPQQCIEAVKTAITPRTKLAILDHITSSTALILPIEQMVGVCHQRGIPVLVDGAHVPANIGLDLQSIDADWYAANLHKWSFAPRGCGFLWAAPGRADGLVPTVLSWDIGDPFPHSFEWTGTRDPSALLSIPAAFAFVDRFGEAAIRHHNHRLIRNALDLLSEAWGVRLETPDSMIGSMALIQLPRGLPFPASLEGCAELRRCLWDSHRIVANPTFVRENTMWLRVSAQIYNDVDDYARLADAINGMRSKAV